MKIGIKIDLQTAMIQAKRIQSALRRARPDLLNQLGVKLLSMSQQAYRQKSRKQRGSDGITWSPLQRATIRARVMRRKPGQRIVAQRKQIALEIAGLKGKGAKAKIESLRQKRKDLMAKLNQMINAEFAKYEIGRDTGLQLSSASPGFVAADGKGGNLLEVNGSVSVTVGYNRVYSKYFDIKRKLLPEKLPSEWQKQLDNVTKKWADKVLKGTKSGS